MQRWRWFSLVVGALALSGCAIGGGVSMGARDGDTGEPSPPDKWRQFEDVAPTLRMTRAQVFDAWRSVTRRSTHRVSLAVLLAKGRTVPEIAVLLGCAPSSVRTHVKRMHRKLGLPRRHDLVRLVLSLPECAGLRYRR